MVRPILLFNAVSKGRPRCSSKVKAMCPLDNKAKPLLLQIFANRSCASCISSIKKIGKDFNEKVDATGAITHAQSEVTGTRNSAFLDAEATFVGYMRVRLE